MRASSKLVRRNSPSLRSPPEGSSAAEMLSTGTTSSDHYYLQARSILSNLKEMSERYSDFGSGYSSSDGAHDDGFKDPVRKKKNQETQTDYYPRQRILSEESKPGFKSSVPEDRFESLV